MLLEDLRGIVNPRAKIATDGGECNLTLSVIQEKDLPEAKKLAISLSRKISILPSAHNPQVNPQITPHR
jgi:hypothetical protein